MNFFLPELVSERLFREHGVSLDIAIHGMKEQLKTARKSTPGVAEAVFFLGQLQMEQHWIDAGRPYYKVWPSISGVLARTRLDVDGKSLSVPCRSIAVRFAETDMQFGRIRSFLMERCSSQYGFDVLSISYGYTSDDPSKQGANINIRLDMDTIEDGLVSGYESDLASISGEQKCGSTDDWMAARVAFSVIMLANDPEFVQPDVLADDRRRFDESTDEDMRKRLIDKARRRGVVGWRVGESFETIPHYRRPHFGVRHTGKGRAVPRVVPIRGAVVHRKKLTDVPTGYITPEGVEVE